MYAVPSTSMQATKLFPKYLTNIQRDRHQVCDGRQKHRFNQKQQECSEENYFSYANTTAKGVVDNNKLQKKNLNLHETASLFNNKLKLDGIATLMTQTVKNSPATGGYYLNPLVSLYSFPRGVDMSTYRENFETWNADRNMMTQNWIEKNGDGTVSEWGQNRKIRYQGFELTVDATPLLYRNFSWKSLINMSANKNNIVTLHPDYPELSYYEEGFNAGYQMRVKEGGSLGDIYGNAFCRNEDGSIMVDEIHKGNRRIIGRAQLVFLKEGSTVQPRCSNVRRQQQSRSRRIWHAYYPEYRL